MYIEILFIAILLIAIEYVMEYIGVRFNFSGKKKVDMSLSKFFLNTLLSLVASVVIYYFDLF
jgi:hypothetical protein